VRKRRHRKSGQSRKPRFHSPTGLPRLTTPEGHEVVFVTARYRHDAPDEIHRILGETKDFGFDEDVEPDEDGSYNFPWYETRPEARPPIVGGRRVLAILALTPKALPVETPSRERMKACRSRLEQLLGKHIHFVETRERSVEQALQEMELQPPSSPPVELPPEMVAEMDERIVRQWIDESIPALGGLSPREAVKTEEGRAQVLALIDQAAQMRKRARNGPGSMPDYTKAKEMLGLE
jgi:hypothetical protein